MILLTDKHVRLYVAFISFMGKGKMLLLFDSPFSEHSKRTLHNHRIIMLKAEQILQKKMSKHEAAFWSTANNGMNEWVMNWLISAANLVSFPAFHFHLPA